MTPSQHPPEERRPIGALLAPDILALLEEAPSQIAAETEEMHPADLADVAEAMPFDQVPVFLAALPKERAADVLEYLDEEMPAAARKETEELRRFDPDSAGGLMTTEYVSVEASTSVEEALRRVRVIARSEKREAMHAVYTTDETGKLAGVLSLRELLAAPEGSTLSDVAWTEPITISPSSDREEVARVISNYDLVVVPVVSESGHLMGVITVDDVIDAIQEEQTEDVQKFGGLQALDEPYMQIGIVTMMKKRAGWLSILLVSEMLTTQVMQHFDAELKAIAVLTLFVPLVVSSGGNSGSQATSLITRAMALREVTLSDWWLVARRELPSGIVLGTILGVIGTLRIALWQKTGWFDYGSLTHSWEQVALTVGCSLVGIVAFGSLAGSMLPFLLRRVGFDPASASAPLVATLVDVTGLSIYFGVAWLLLLR